MRLPPACAPPVPPHEAPSASCRKYTCRRGARQWLKLQVGARRGVAPNGSKDRRGVTHPPTGLSTRARGGGARAELAGAGRAGGVA